MVEDSNKITQGLFFTSAAWSLFDPEIHSSLVKHKDLFSLVIPSAKSAYSLEVSGCT